MVKEERHVFLTFNFDGLEQTGSLISAHSDQVPEDENDNESWPGFNHCSRFIAEFIERYKPTW
jgi:hypothetical protein